MISKRLNSQLVSSRRSVGLGIAFAIITLVVGANHAFAAPKPKITSPTTDSATVGVPYSYQITADQTITTWGAAPLPAGLTVNTGTGLISGTPTTAGIYSITLSATNANGTGTQTLTLTISNPTPTPIPGNAFVGFRLPDFPANPTPAPTPAANNMRLMLQIGATQGGVAHPFNATLEVQVPGTTTWVPYNRFVGVDDPASWITDAPLPVRDLPGSSPAPTPYPAPPAFNATQLTESPPAVYVKADPRSTRFGIFQMDTNPTGNSRIINSIWPSGSAALANGYGGNVSTTFPAPVEHAPQRFAGTNYFPATLCINNAASTSTRTGYADEDGIIRPADASYPDPSVLTTGSSTPFYTTDLAYHPIVLNRPFRNVAELGYAFRDLPWKTLDLFNQNSADAGLLDVFSINDVPAVVAGRVNLNTRQTGGLQAILAGGLWDDTSITVSNTGAPTVQNAQTMATNIATATSTTLTKNKSELIMRAGLPTTILPVTSSQDNQTVKARREVVPRAITSVSQTRVWNVLIDVVAQSGRYAPGETNLTKFNVEGQQHYWIHVAIDRFTGQVLDKQIEVVNE